MNRIVAVTLCALALVACGAGTEEPSPDGGTNPQVVGADGGTSDLVYSENCQGPVYIDWGFTEINLKFNYQQWTDGGITVDCSATFPDGSVVVPEPGHTQSEGSCRILIYTNSKGGKNYVHAHYDGTRDPPGVYVATEGPDREYPTDNSDTATWPEDAPYANFMWPQGDEGPPMACVRQ